MIPRPQFDGATSDDKLMYCSVRNQHKSIKDKLYAT